MNLKDKVAVVIQAAQDAKGGAGKHTSYKIFTECGLAQGTIQRYVNGTSDIGRMGLDVAVKIGEYYDKYF